MTPDLEDRVFSLFASGLGWEDAAAELGWVDLNASLVGLPTPSGFSDISHLRTSVQNLWREYVSGKDKA